jgi:hypothetical protein
MKILRLAPAAIVAIALTAACSSTTGSGAPAASACGCLGQIADAAVACFSAWSLGTPGKLSDDGKSCALPDGATVTFDASIAQAFPPAGGFTSTLASGALCAHVTWSGDESAGTFTFSLTTTRGEATVSGSKTTGGTRVTCPDGTSYTRDACGGLDPELQFAVGVGTPDKSVGLVIPQSTPQPSEKAYTVVACRP